MSSNRAGVNNDGVTGGGGGGSKAGSSVGSKATSPHDGRKDSHEKMPGAVERRKSGTNAMTALEDEPGDRTLEVQQDKEKSRTMSASVSKEDVVLPEAKVVTDEEIA